MHKVKHSKVINTFLLRQISLEYIIDRWSVIKRNIMAIIVNKEEKRRTIALASRELLLEHGIKNITISKIIPIILRRNLTAINEPNEDNSFESDYLQYHDIIREKTINNNDYRLNISPFLNTINNENGSLKHEMAVEASLIYQLSNMFQETLNIFGNWDYLSHQVIASPFKPIDYMDKKSIVFKILGSITKIFRSCFLS